MLFQTSHYNDLNIIAQEKNLGLLGIHLVQKKRGKLLTSHRSTSYLCYVPVLEDLEGAGRTRLTPATKVVSILEKAINFIFFFFLLLPKKLPSHTNQTPTKSNYCPNTDIYQYWA
jgi:hypothetical protein